MHAVGLRCTNCGHEYPLDVWHYECTRCRWPLEVYYSKPQKNAEQLRGVLNRAKRLWDYRQFLPVREPGYIVSLGEGGTPLLSVSRLVPNHTSIFIKNEAMNPTGSFKDRPISVIISKAREHGVQKVITASSGNAGGALAAYAAAAGIQAVVVVPESTPREKLVSIMVYGARIIKVRGTASDAVRLVSEICSRQKWLNATTTFANPYGLEGDKTVAYEIVRDLGFEVPSYVLIPVGAGPLLVGCYKGFRDLYEWGLIDSIPRLVAVQAEGCAPIAKAWRDGRDMVEAWNSPRTIASGIADPLLGYEKDGSLTLKFVKRSRGLVLTVSDDEIIAAARLLAEKAGIFTEPTGAVALAGLQRLIRAGQFDTGGKKVVCIVTGSGFKDLYTVEAYLDTNHIPLVDPYYKDILDWLPEV